MNQQDDSQLDQNANGMAIDHGNNDKDSQQMGESDKDHPKQTGMTSNQLPFNSADAPEVIPTDSDPEQKQSQAPSV